jgi:hypothetical protein
VIPVGLTTMTWDAVQMRDYVNNMEKMLQETNESALNLLLKHTAGDLSQLKEAVLAVLDSWEQQDANDRLEWNPHVGDNAMLANLEVHARDSRRHGLVPHVHKGSRI